MTQIDIYCADPPTQLSIPLGDGRIMPSGGYGGWELVDRPRRKALTEWVKSDPFRLEIPIQFDGWKEGASQEPDIQELEDLARRDDGDDPPSVILVTCPGGVPRDPSIEWVIEDIDWLEDELRGEGDQRLRQGAVLHLLEFVEDEWLKVLSPSRKRKKRRKRKKPSKGGNRKYGGAPRFYTVKAGDTLQSIAAAELGRRVLWKEIAQRNSMRDPDRIEVGQKLRMP